MISAGLRPEHLTDEQKNWYAVAICGAIIADGNVAPEEVAYLETALSFLSSNDRVGALIQAVKDQRLPPLQQLTQSTREINMKMLIELTLVLASDNLLSTREMDYLFKVGRKLGFGPELIQIVLRWANEGIVWRNKLSLLIKSGAELEPEYEL